MNPQEILKQLFLADGGPYSLSSAMSARSGSGKTTLLSTLIEQAVKLEDFREQRFIYASLKGENPFKGAPVTSNVLDLRKKLKKSRIVVFYPHIEETYEAKIDELIEMVFSLADANPDAGFHITIDDSNILKGFTARGSLSGSVKKLAIAGRSKGIRGLFITHRLGWLPTLMNGNLSALILMSMNGSDADFAEKKFGLDFKELITDLGEFRWSVVDLLTDKIYKFDPVKV